MWRLSPCRKLAAQICQQLRVPEYVSVCVCVCVSAQYIGSPAGRCSGGLTSFQFVSARALNTLFEETQLGLVERGREREEGLCSHPARKSKSPPRLYVHECGPSEARAHAHFVQIWQEANRKINTLPHTQHFCIPLQRVYKITRNL